MKPVENPTVTSVGVSVIICCYNSASRLPETLKHLARQDLPKSTPWELIVIDDNDSTDDTMAVAVRLWQATGAPAPLNLMQEARPGKSFALETGFSTARYDTLVMVDDDNWLNEQYLKVAFDLLREHPEVGVIGGNITASFEIDPPSWFAQFQNGFAIGPQGNASGDITNYKNHVAGAGMVVRKAAYEELKRRNFRYLLSGGRRGNLTAGDDLELCYALVLAGYRIWYDENLRLTHFMPKGRLTMDNLLNLFRRTEAAWPVMNCYLAALGENGPSVMGRYLRAVGVHSQWVVKSAAKLLLGRHSFMLFRFEFLGWWHSLFCLPALRRAFKMHYEDIARLKINPPIK